MHGNYEAQSHFTRERLAARRNQAMEERLLRQDRQVRVSSLRQLLMRLFLRSVHRAKGTQHTRSAALAKKSKGKFA